MVSKKTLKFVKSLQLKKYRKQEQSFIVEGAKNVLELVRSNFRVTTIFATPLFLNDNLNLLQKFDFEIFEVDEGTLASIGSFKTNNTVLAVAKTRENIPIKVNPHEFSLLLDDVRDPGNMGTIIRIADWYGINKIICSKECADFYNPKVIAASMGSFTRIEVYYTELASFIKGAEMDVYGAFMKGENVHKINFGPGGLILMGNESKGIDPELANLNISKIHIPRFGGAESLNVAVATAVICDNLKRGKGS